MERSARSTLKGSSEEQRQAAMAKKRLQALRDSDARMAWWVVITVCVVLVCGPAAITFAQEERPAPTPELFDLGKQLYGKQCAVCHGEAGRGDGAAAYLLYPKPRDFTLDEFRLISTQEMAATDHDLFQTLTRGMPGSSMPSWEGLSGEARWALVYYVRYLEEIGEEIDAGELTQAEVEAGLPWERIEALVTKHGDVQSMEVPPEPAVTPEALERGKVIYGQACAACHGPKGTGDAQVAMVDNQGVPTTPRDLTAGLFKGSGESLDLYYRMMGGLPGSPMPGYAGVYSEEDVWALIHYVQSLVPPGVVERAGASPMTIRARQVAGELPADPFAEHWQQIASTYVAVSPLWWRDDRIPSVEVQAVHNGTQLAVRLSWEDPTVDESAVRTEDFPDGVAVQLSAATDPPFFGMGNAHDGVNIWHWKASWQRDVTTHHADVEDVYPDMMVEYYPNQKNWELGTHQENTERDTTEHDPELLTGLGVGNPFSDPRKTTAAEDLSAEGQGTLTSRSPSAQRVQGTGQYLEGRWAVVFTRDVAARDKTEVTLQPGTEVSLAVAVWDGAADDRDGQKSFSIWHTLDVES